MTLTTLSCSPLDCFQLSQRRSRSGSLAAELMAQLNKLLAGPTAGRPLPAALVSASVAQEAR